jgi:hypothetical protein
VLRKLAGCLDASLGWQHDLRQCRIPKGAEMTALSLRRLWLIYKRTTLAQGIGDSKRDLALAHIAFYSGARGVLRVLDQMLSVGDYDDLHETIASQGRAIRALRGRLRRPRIQ